MVEDLKSMNSVTKIKSDNFNENEREMVNALLEKEVILRDKIDKEEERKGQEKKEAKELCKSILKKELELSERHEKEENTWKKEKDLKSWKDQKERDARLFGYDGPLIHLYLVLSVCLSVCLQKKTLLSTKPLLRAGCCQDVV